MNKNIHQFGIKQKQAFIRRKQIWIGPVILCPTYSTQSKTGPDSMLELQDNGRGRTRQINFRRSGGQGEIRTRDLYNANVAIFQLIYLPSG